VTETDPLGKVEGLLRELAPQALGIVARRFEDFSAVEDAVQEALIAAHAQWTANPLPQHPLAWLVAVASRRMADYIRREVSRRTRETETYLDRPAVLAPDIYRLGRDEPDDILRLLFICCHPSLSTASAIALTLRAVGGLTTAEIARAFLIPEATMGQRISRGKETIKASNISFEMPDEAEQRSRLSAVLRVLYLIFNEGYAASTGALVHRIHLSREAIRLTRKAHALLPENGEAAGLLALMLLTDARRSARTGPSGELIPLDEQDRSRWSQELIREGQSLVTPALTHGTVGEYALQAAIAALHDEAPSTEKTDWSQIHALYQVLYRIAPSPMVALNRAVALAMADTPQAGLKELETLASDPRLRQSHRLDAARAHLLELAGQIEEAIQLYHAAAARTGNLPERNYLILRAAKLKSHPYTRA
jgi:RNA polymerase sigma factor (sigma-70 family)